MSKVFNISVVGGAGHIGLPLSCFLQNHGHKVTVIDKNQKVMNDASNGIEPFEEIDFEDNLNEALKNKKHVVTANKALIASELLTLKLSQLPIYGALGIADQILLASASGPASD